MLPVHSGRGQHRCLLGARPGPPLALAVAVVGAMALAAGEELGGGLTAGEADEGGGAVLLLALGLGRTLALALGGLGARPVGGAGVGVLIGAPVVGGGGSVVGIITEADFIETEAGRTTDPVRMYMREMGTIELLDRQGEIVIAKKIEDGNNKIQATLSCFIPVLIFIQERYQTIKEIIAQDEDKDEFHIYSRSTFILPLWIVHTCVWTSINSL